MTVFTRITTHVVFGLEQGRLEFSLEQRKFRLAERGRLRGVVVSEPCERGQHEPTDQKCFYAPVHFGPPEEYQIRDDPEFEKGRAYSRTYGAFIM